MLLGEHLGGGEERRLAAGVACGPSPLEGFDAVVVRTTAVTPHMLRVTFGGEGLRDYEAEGFPDDYCKILFPHPGDDAPVVPIEVDGLQKTPEGEQDAPMRNYTIRRHDPSVPEIDIDFVAVYIERLAG